MNSKNSTCNEILYLPIIDCLKKSTNLISIQKKLSISKQKLNYYLRRMIDLGLIEKKGRGWYEVKNRSKTSTKYGTLLSKDYVRGHGYIWNIDLEKKPQDWDKRIEIIKKKGIHFKLVGAKNTTPRIKVLGRKIWLCNNKIRVFDKKEASYYGENAIKSRKRAFNEIRLITEALSKKLGIIIRPSKIQFRKEHYALIKNDLAIHTNKQGEIIRVSDEKGEWLLVDDSLGRGGELETVGKDAFKTNIPMQRWWNDNKKHNFKITPTFLMEQLGGMLQVQQMHSHNIVKHQKVLDEMLLTLKQIRDNLK